MMGDTPGNKGPMSLFVDVAYYEEHAAEDGDHVGYYGVGE
jgi:hypothetical protein